MKKERVLLAGATGYLGRFITRELMRREFATRIIVRDKTLVESASGNPEVIEAQVTRSETLVGICREVDIVISTVGITRQKDGLTYMDVDYQANLNLIREAKKSGVKKFIYISVLNGEKLRDLKICEAKEKLGDYLKASGLDYCIIRPNGFFSDMREFLSMAKRGTVFIFGKGEYKMNPIHGRDLAKVVVDSVHLEEKEMDIGGPELFTQNEIAGLAMKAYSNPVKIMHLPDSVRKWIIWIFRTFTPSEKYGPVEFFMTTMGMDMQAPQYGTMRLQDFFNEEVRKNGE